MQKPAKQYFTPEEYLAIEETNDYKSEYYRGEIYALAGASINHNRIAGNMYSRLNQYLLTKKCEAFMSDMRIWIETNEMFAYPENSIKIFISDISNVVCEPNGHIHKRGPPSIKIEGKNFIGADATHIDTSPSFNYRKSFGLANVKVVAPGDSGYSCRKRYLPPAIYLNSFHEASSFIGIML